MNYQNLELLVVEDDDAIREGISDILLLEGFRVLESSNGKEALDILVDWEPDLVISDVMMPIMDGHSLLENYKHLPNSKNIPFLFLTALSDRSDIRKGMNLGADDYLTKPFSRKELLDAVNVQYQKYSMRKESAEQEQIKRFEKSNRLSKVEKKTLVQEMHHRVKHNLAIISAFFELGEMSDDPQFLDSIKERIQAMSSVHEEVYSNDLVTKVNSKKLINNILDTFFKNSKIIINKNLKCFDISISKAIPLGLLLYEFLSMLIQDSDLIKDNCLTIDSHKTTEKSYLIFSFCNDSWLQQSTFEEKLGGLLIHSYLSQLKSNFRKDSSKSNTRFILEY